MRKHKNWIKISSHLFSITITINAVEIRQKGFHFFFSPLKKRNSHSFIHSRLMIYSWKAIRNEQWRCKLQWTSVILIWKYIFSGCSMFIQDKRKRRGQQQHETQQSWKKKKEKAYLGCIAFDPGSWFNVIMNYAS